MSKENIYSVTYISIQPAMLKYFTNRAYCQEANHLHCTGTGYGPDRELTMNDLDAITRFAMT